MQILNFKNIELEVNQKLLFKVKNISINTGVVKVIIGKNGSGKTSLLRYISKK